MIGMLHGQVDFIDAASAIIEVGGVGYETRSELKMLSL